MSTGIRPSARTHPSATATSATITVRGRRNASEINPIAPTLRTRNAETSRKFAENPYTIVEGRQDPATFAESADCGGRAELRTRTGPAEVASGRQGTDPAASDGNAGA